MQGSRKRQGFVVVERDYDHQSKPGRTASRWRRWRELIVVLLLIRVRFNNVEGDRWLVYDRSPSYIFGRFIQLYNSNNGVNNLVLSFFIVVFFIGVVAFIYFCFRYMSSVYFSFHLYFTGTKRKLASKNNVFYSDWLPFCMIDSLCKWTQRKSAALFLVYLSMFCSVFYVFIDGVTWRRRGVFFHSFQKLKSSTFWWGVTYLVLHALSRLQKLSKSFNFSIALYFYRF